MRKSILMVSIAGIMGISPTAALALGLGNIQIVSQHGEPFKGIIPIQSVRKSDEGSLVAGFAQNESAYSMAGISLPEDGWKAEFKDSPSPHILLTAPFPLTENVHLLIEAKWTGGQIMREYTLSKEAEPLTHSLASIPLSEKPSHFDRSIAQKHLQTETSNVYQGWASMDHYRVREGQTLSEIANALRKNMDVTTDQVMVALVKNNPSAFIDGNPNLVREDALLSVPDLQKVQAIAPIQAFTWIRQQSEPSIPSTAMLLHKNKTPVPVPVVKAHHSKNGIDRPVIREIGKKTDLSSVIKEHPVQKNVVEGTRVIVHHSSPKKQSFTVHQNPLVKLPPIVQQSFVVEKMDQENIQKLMHSDRVLEARVREMDDMANHVQQGINENAIQIHDLTSQHKDTLNNLLPWVSTGGNVILLLLFIWLYRRQNGKESINDSEIG